MAHSGGIGYEDGKTCDGRAAIKCMTPGEHNYTFNSITCELKDDELVYKLQASANCYRAEKLPLYYANEVFEAGKGALLGSLIATSTTKMKISAEKSVEIIPDKYKINIVEELDRVLVQGEFEENYMVQIILTAENGDKFAMRSKLPIKNSRRCASVYSKRRTANRLILLSIKPICQANMTLKSSSRKMRTIS